MCFTTRVSHSLVESWGMNLYCSRGIMCWFLNRVSNLLRMAVLLNFFLVFWWKLKEQLCSICVPYFVKIKPIPKKNNNKGKVIWDQRPFKINLSHSKQICFFFNCWNRSSPQKDFCESLLSIFNFYLV